MLSVYLWNFVRTLLVSQKGIVLSQLLPDLSDVYIFAIDRVVHVNLFFLHFFCDFDVKIVINLFAVSSLKIDAHTAHYLDHEQHESNNKLVNQAL